MANDKKDRVSMKTGGIGEEEKKKALETALSQIEKTVWQRRCDASGPK